MGAHAAPRRVLLKLSGNVLSGTGAAPFDDAAAGRIACELQKAWRTCPQIAVVVGGGNIIRGAQFCREGRGRILADHAGMLATAVNVLLLRHRLDSLGVPAAHYCAFPVPRMLDLFEPGRAIADLERGKLVLLAGGTGNPFLTTDTAAALRALELEADLLLKATRVDGAYSDDPEKDPNARLLPRLTYREVLDRRLAVMDLAAIGLCWTHRLPVRIFNFAVENNIQRAVAGEDLGTLIGSAEDAD